ncbi:MAG: M14 family metallopeptidase [Bacteriovoracales bacterium]|nr:M14 family metallopeptidase [Bacteriovoracales bacterium]
MKKLFLLLSFCCYGISFSVWAQTYGDVVAEMEALKRQYPTLARLVNLGENDQGIPITGLRIRRPELLTPREIPHLLVGTHHGNEEDAAPLSLAFARKVLEILSRPFPSDRDDADRPTQGIESGTFYVFPVLNISGHDAKSRYERTEGGAWVDPNRDYPDACRKAPFFRLQSTSLLAEFIDSHGIVSAITVHGYRGTFTYPWGFFTEDPTSPDQEIYHDLLSYAVEANGYRVGNHKEVMYPVTGTFEDWAYHTYGVWTALLEMKHLPDYGADVEALLRFFERVPKQRSRDHAHYGQCIPIPSVGLPVF